MIPATVPPFPFYIINKDIIKGSFPFRKTFHTPKPDFTTSISTAPSVPPTRRAGTELRKRNKPEAKDALPAEARFHNPDFAARIRPPRVFRRPEEPKQNHGNGTNRRRRTLCLPKPDFATSISHPRFRPPRVFRRPEEPKQNPGNGTNRRRRTLCLPKPDFTTPISHPRFRPPRVFRRPEEPEQNHGNGTNRRRRKVFQSGEHANSKIILSLPPKTSKPDSRHHRPVRQKVRF